MFCKLFLLKNLCRNTGGRQDTLAKQEALGMVRGMDAGSFLGEKRKLWRCSGDALGVQGKEGAGLTEPSMQEQGVG